MVKLKPEDIIFNDLSLRYKLDKRVIREISFHPLLFFKRKAESGDTRPIRIMYWGAFVPKQFKKSKINAMKYIAKTLLKNIGEAYEAIPQDFYAIYPNIKIFRNVIEEALAANNKPMLDELYGFYKEYLKNN